MLDNYFFFKLITARGCDIILPTIYDSEVESESVMLESSNYLYTCHVKETDKSIINLEIQFKYFSTGRIRM